MGEPTSALIIEEGLAIPEEELELSFVRSSGAGTFREAFVRILGEASLGGSPA